MKTTKIEKLHSCREGIKWTRSQKNYKTAWQNCERGDWMLWLANRLNVDDRKFTMAKAMCAKQVEHLMKDQRSKDALQACFDYGNGKISRDELNVYAAAADDAADAYTAYDAADADAYAYAAYDAYTAAYVYAADAAAMTATADAFYAAYADSLRKSADICREYLTEEVLTAYKKLQ